MKIIYSNKGHEILVDDEDFELALSISWSLNNRGYTSGGKDGKSFSMHRFLMKAEKGTQIDHIDGNKLNNQKHNLRVCNNKLNNAYRPPSKANILGLKGVTEIKGRPGLKKRFRARIHADGKERSLGVYATPEEAALAYNEAALKEYGEFAWLNKMEVIV
jgi:hypothetical protein